MSAVPRPPRPSAEDAARGAVCGRPWVAVDGGEGWLHLEVTRSHEAAGVDFLVVDFRTQAHAAQWPAGPLPPVDRPIDRPIDPVPMPTSWSERVGMAVLVLCLLWTAGLALLGGHALIGLLRGWH